jgi:uncharacterized pyridoxamine 5'-phosphate oxidase family protein
MDTHVLKHLEANRSGFFATIDGNKPRVRPFEFQFEDKGRLFFCTSNKKDVYAQLKKNPSFEFSSTSPEYVTVRLNGEAVFSDEIAVKERIIAENKLVASIYKSADNPMFSIFYIEHGKTIVSDFSGNPSKHAEF